jgi:hypothetical protein
MTYEEFKTTYNQEITELKLIEEAVVLMYDMYLEDPMQFRPEMMYNPFNN